MRGNIFLRCYPREFIFAEKLEAVVFRGASNTRMKDFHDLYSLVKLDNLNDSLTEKAIQLVFYHRKNLLKKLPITFNRALFETLEKNWGLYYRKLKKKELFGITRVHRGCGLEFKSMAKQNNQILN